eukprot:1753350-Pyramimonas_sp.AAC.1
MASGITESLGRKFWGAGIGRSAVDCAWVQSARSEADCARGLHSWSWVIDWPKYCEHAAARA